MNQKKEGRREVSLCERFPQPGGYWPAAPDLATHRLYSLSEIFPSRFVSAYWKSFASNG